MKELTKPYRIIYVGEDIVLKILDAAENLPTIPGSVTESEEFDTLEELQNFIIEKNIKDESEDE